MARFTHVRRYKTGASWDDGSTRTCSTCRIERNRGDRSRANQATVVANRRDGAYKLPVAYCDDHIPIQLQGDHQ